MIMTALGTPHYSRGMAVGAQNSIPVFQVHLNPEAPSMCDFGNVNSGESICMGKNEGMHVDTIGAE